jgi:hypothetical protein
MSERRADDGISEDDRRAFEAWLIERHGHARDRALPATGFAEAAWHAATRRARAAPAGAPRVGEWIPVGERLPAMGQLVKLLAADEETEGRLGGGGAWTHGAYGFGKVTHWRELEGARPAPPSPAEMCRCGRGMIRSGPGDVNPWCEGCCQPAATCDCVPVVAPEGLAKELHERLEAAEAVCRAIPEKILEPHYVTFLPSYDMGLKEYPVLAERMEAWRALAHPKLRAPAGEGEKGSGRAK